jgi:DNA polymerase-3 subunit delta'
VQDACGKCEDCLALAAGTHPDYHLIDRHLNQHHPDPQIRARRGPDLSIEVIRHFVLDRVTHRPAQGRAKVFLLADADEMTIPAQNALLKTLEEPPGTTFLILRSRSADRLLPTTRSRCQVVSFGALPIPFVERQLIEQDGLDAPTANFAAGYSEGRLGWIREQLAGGLLDRRAAVMPALGRLNPESALDVARVLTQEATTFGRALEAGSDELSDVQAGRAGTAGVLNLLANGLRHALNVSLGRDDPVGSGEDRLSRTLAERVPAERLLACIEAIGEAESQIDRNANVQLAMEGLTIRLGRLLAGGHPRQADSRSARRS